MRDLRFRKFDTSAAVEYCSIASSQLGIDLWNTTNSFIYYIGEDKGDTFVRVPAYFLTDGASIPSVFWSMIPPWGRYGQAAILHDFLCEYLQIEEGGYVKSITREEADLIFREALGVLEVPKITIKVIMLGVSTFRVLGRVTKPSRSPLKERLEETLRKDAFIRSQMNR